jgi:DNA (cytosine-5)-methyltransferase 1
LIHNALKSRFVLMPNRKSPLNVPTVVDIYSGAGANAEGFRQQGFKVLLGVDNWQPAVDTFTYNQKAKCLNADVLVISNSVESIESTIPDSTVITGSPPCISFSSSNRSGKADKKLGKKLMKAYLKIVAVKRHKKESKLKAWFMENVGKSAGHVKSSYTFRELGLGRWAEEIGRRPGQVAIKVKPNSIIINAAEYGAPQSRKRLFVGEIFGHASTFPKPTHGCSPGQKPYVTMQFVRSCLPSPNLSKAGIDIIITDPNYYELSLHASLLSDQFYDTGLRSDHWKRSKFLKTNHPFMGKMSFPEREDRPSRTVMATSIGSSRESIVLKCERGRIDDGEYRTLTVRESACLMGFPITYQFIGSAASKLKLVGNAVCPQVSNALAGHVRSALGLRHIRSPRVRKIRSNKMSIPNLNDHKVRAFKAVFLPENSKFRRHLFKDGNMTVELTNFDILSRGANVNGTWRSFILYSNGEGYQKKAHEVRANSFKNLEPVIRKHLHSADRFIKIINNGFSERIPNARLMQTLLERKEISKAFDGPALILEKITNIIDQHYKDRNLIHDRRLPFKKDSVPLRQVLALYAINKVVSMTND